MDFKRENERLRSRYALVIFGIFIFAIGSVLFQYSRSPGLIVATLGLLLTFCGLLFAIFADYVIDQKRENRRRRRFTRRKH
jgi:hypothetical protein